MIRPKAHDKGTQDQPADDPATAEVIAALVAGAPHFARLALAVARASSSRASPSPRLHQHGDEARLAELGVTPRSFADAARAGLIDGAVRGARGWCATEASIIDHLARRRDERRDRRRAPSTKLVVLRDAGSDVDTLRRAAGGRTR